MKPFCAQAGVDVDKVTIADQPAIPIICLAFLVHSHLEYYFSPENGALAAKFVLVAEVSSHVIFTLVFWFSSIRVSAKLRDDVYRKCAAKRYGALEKEAALYMRVSKAVHVENVSGSRAELRGARARCAGARREVRLLLACN